MPTIYTDLKKLCIVYNKRENVFNDSLQAKQIVI